VLGTCSKALGLVIWWLLDIHQAVERCNMPMLEASLKHGALSLLDAVLHFGSYGVHWSWPKTDWWFALRSLVQFQKSASPLSPGWSFIKFFVHKYSMGNFSEFGRWMAAYGKMGWPLGNFGEFWAWWHSRPKWLEVNDILTNLTALKYNARRNRVYLIVGADDHDRY
jgi:hypothetical protein